MAVFRVLFRESVYKDLRRIPKTHLPRILDKIRALGHNPRPPGYEKLTGQERYRVRQGRYRVVYSIHDDHLEVWIVRVGHRKEIYRRD